MQSGILTDTFSAERVAAMAQTDWRRRAPNFREPALSANIALRDALRPIAERHATTVSAVAIGWVLAWPGVTGAIVGARSPEQVDGWVGGSGIRLTEDDLAEIANAAAAAFAGSGPVHPLVAVSGRPSRQ
jgi:aryl-alcohol dehydrogenase-like predicted oxidoreductase